MNSGIRGQNNGRPVVVKNKNKKRNPTTAFDRKYNIPNLFQYFPALIKYVFSSNGVGTINNR